MALLAGTGGDGKTWTALFLADAVHRGGDAGIPCRKGHTLLLDAGSGPKLVKRRLRDAGIPVDAITYLDADGLDQAVNARPQLIDADGAAVLLGVPKSWVLARGTR